MAPSRYIIFDSNLGILLRTDPDPYTYTYIHVYVLTIYDCLVHPRRRPTRHTIGPLSCHGCPEVEAFPLTRLQHGNVATWSLATWSTSSLSPNLSSWSSIGLMQEMAGTYIVWATWVWGLVRCGYQLHNSCPCVSNSSHKNV